MIITPEAVQDKANLAENQTHAPPQQSDEEILTKTLGQPLMEPQITKSKLFYLKMQL